MPRPRVRPANASELPLLPAIECAATSMFRSIPALADLADGAGLPLHRYSEIQDDGGLVLVALSDSSSSSEPIGFAVAYPLDASLFIFEVDVSTSHQGRGVGTALLEAVCAEAAQKGLDSVTLTTYEEVPWNGPFYARRGWSIVEAGLLGQGHLDKIRKERGGKEEGGEGLQREGWKRCCMVRHL